jgi:hypothetical protein
MFPAKIKATFLDLWCQWYKQKAIVQIFFGKRFSQD